MAALAALADAVRTRRISATALVRASLQRIAELDPQIGAIASLREKQAEEEASHLDKQVARGLTIGPLAGIPCLIKDVDDVRGMRTLQGSRTQVGIAPSANDSHVTARLRAAGAIVIGKTTSPEFAAEGYTSSLLHGDTRNPWSIQYTPGGSSGGSAAALASGMAPIASGTDGGGSIRIPAAFCGLVGLKPTRGVIPRRPIPPWPDMTSDGVLATSLADARLLLEVLAGMAVGDPDSSGFLSPANEEGPSHAFVLKDSMTRHGLDPEIARLLQCSSRAFAAIWGVAITEVTSADLFAEGNPDEDWYVICSAEHVSALGRNWVEEHLAELHPATQDFLAFGLEVGLDGYLAARRRRFAYASRIDQLLGSRSVVLSPSVGVTSLPADGRLPDGRIGAWPMDTYTTAWQNLTGHPAISLPSGRSEVGVPFGLQVTAPRYADQWLLDVSRAWERAHPWPQTAPGYAPFTLEELA